jgi:putative membrane protein
MALAAPPRVCSRAVLLLEKRSWLQIVWTMHGSALPRIWRRLLATFAVACAVTVAHDQWGLLHSSLSPLPFSLIGVALGVFLGFRNNASYDRYWEARKLWGQLVNVSRTLARRTTTYLVSTGADEAEANSAIHACLGRTVAFAHLLRMHLRGEWNPTSIESLVNVNEFATIEGASNRPQALLSFLGRSYRAAWKRGWIDTLHVPLFEECLASMADVQGGSERIRSTPIPSSYTILMHQIVAVYCFTLPFGIVSEVHEFTPFVVLLISFAFLGLDAIGEEIEEPFGRDANDLPLSAICHTIETDLRAMRGDKLLPSAPAPVAGVVH